VTVPTGWTGIASGTPAGHRGSTFRYHSADPVASYATTLAVGKYRAIRQTGPHGIPITVWYLPHGADQPANYRPQLTRIPS
jgi:aminopeptidase N